MRNLATLGFPAPDTDHQKHVLSFGEALNMARLYIAIWMQKLVKGQRATIAGPSEAGLHPQKQLLATQKHKEKLTKSTFSKKLEFINSSADQKDLFSNSEKRGLESFLNEIALYFHTGPRPSR